MDYKAILNLMKEMNHTDLTKVEIEENGTRICMEKGNIAPVLTTSQPITPQINASIPGPQTPIASASPSVSKTSTSSEKAQEELEGNMMCSPMVGTFYAQAGPDKPPFVKVGDKVKKGQTLCIIEAMKLMNEIESEFDGEIVKILVKNEQMVEFGQPLFVIQ